MTTNEKWTLLQMQLADKYPVAMTPEQVAEALAVSRRYVDKLFDRTDAVRARGGDPEQEGCLVYFVLDSEKERQEKRVNQASLITYMLHVHKK